MRAGLRGAQGLTRIRSRRRPVGLRGAGRDQRDRRHHLRRLGNVRDHRGVRGVHRRRVGLRRDTHRASCHRRRRTERLHRGDRGAGSSGRAVCGYRPDHVHDRGHRGCVHRCRSRPRGAARDRHRRRELRGFSFRRRGPSANRRNHRIFSPVRAPPGARDGRSDPYGRCGRSVRCGLGRVGSSAARMCGRRGAALGEPRRRRASARGYPRDGRRPDGRPYSRCRCGDRVPCGTSDDLRGARVG